MQFTFKSEMACLSKRAARPEQNSNSARSQHDSARKNVTLTPTVFQSQNGAKVYPVPDRNADF